MAMGKGQPEAIKREFFKLGIVTEKVCMFPRCELVVVLTQNQ